MASVFFSMAGVSGCYGVAIADLCRRVGVSNRAFYQTFSGKEECFVLGFDLLVTPLLDRAEEAFEQTQGSWAQRLGAGLQVIMTTLAADPPAARSCVLETFSAGPDALEHLRAVIVRTQAVFGCTRGGLVLPALGGDPLCSMHVGALLGPVQGYLRADQADRLPELVPGFVSFLVRVGEG